MATIYLHEAIVELIFAKAKETNMKQSEIAAMAGVSQMTVSKILTMGKKRGPRAVIQQYREKREAEEARANQRTPVTQKKMDRRNDRRRIIREMEKHERKLQAERRARKEIQKASRYVPPRTVPAYKCRCGYTVTLDPCLICYHGKD